jgi:hypothetical protein
LQQQEDGESHNTFSWTGWMIGWMDGWMEKTSQPRCPFIICNCPFSYHPPKWTTTHQCTNWPFYPRDGVHFFIQPSLSQLFSVFDI